MNQVHDHDTTPAQRAPEYPSRLSELMRSGVDVKLHLVQHYAELTLLLAREILDDEVGTLCGERYSRDKPLEGRYRRWGSNLGSIKVQEERVPIDVPRVRDIEAGKERPLETYQRLREPVEVNTQLEEAILYGLSQRDYGRVTSAFMEGFGLSQSSVSRVFQERSAKALEAFEARSLAGEDVIALWMDGKYLAGVQIVICLGLTFDGRKIPLGFVETTTENAEAIRGLLQDLIGRGLSFEHGLLCVVDGSKGLTKAVRDTFGERVQVQRCQWHKRENVVSYLPAKDQDTYRKRLQRAYQQPEYDEAKKTLMAIHAELDTLNRSAARSLAEGLEETLTLHRLGVFEALGKNLKTTNGIENLNSQLIKYIGRVKRWMDSDQRQRWIAMGLVEIEQRMRRVDHPEHLAQLRTALKATFETTPSPEPLAESNFN